MHNSSDSPTAFRSLCFHVKTVIGTICFVELVVIAFGFVSKIEYPSMICRTVNVSRIEEISEGRGPARLFVHEERVCSSYSVLVLLVIFHGLTDAIALMGVFMQQHKLVVPLLILLPFNIGLSMLFFANAIFTYVTVSHNYDGYFVCFVFIQFVLRIYEFRVARKFCRYCQKHADSFVAPQTAVVKDGEHMFQF